jgi:hypothetical protein
MAKKDLRPTLDDAIKSIQEKVWPGFRYEPVRRNF